MSFKDQSKAQFEQLSKSGWYLSLIVWRTRAFWLRAFLSFAVGALFLLLDEGKNFDWRFSLRGPQPHDSRLVLIEVNELDWTLLHRNESENQIRPLKELNTFSEEVFWSPPAWERLLNEVLKNDPLAVGVTFFFGETTGYHQLSTQQIRLFSDPRVIWSADLDAMGRAVVPDFVTAYGAQTALKTLRADDDGVVRRYSTSLVKFPGLPMALARFSPQVDIDRAQAQWDRPQLINFMGPARTYPTFSLRQVLQSEVVQNQLRGKIILVGSRSNPADQMQTPLGRLSRAEVFANVTDNMIGQKAIKRAPKSIYLAGLIGLVLLSVWILSSYPQAVALIFFLWIGTLLAAGSAWAFDSFYVWVPVLSPLVQLGFTYIIFLSYQLAQNEQRTWRLEQERRYLFEVEELKNNFLSMMSHDLKTPIAKIQGIVDRLLLNSSNDLTSDLKSLRRSADDLHRYIQSILNVTRVEAKELKVRREVIDINEIIDRVICSIRPLAQEKFIRIDQNLEPMFSIEADPGLIQEVILNLVENAIKYTPDGGHILVSSQEINDSVIVTVEDTGVGIEENDIDRVWGKFNRGTNVHFQIKGTGLGLYLVKYFVELHGGNVFLESRPGAGTKVGFSIPVLHESADLAHARSERDLATEVQTGS